jgi:hypothetical protein
MNIESKRRQYDVAQEARRRGFRDIEVIEDDLGRSAQPTAWWLDRAPRVWSRCCVQARSERYCVRTPHASHETGATGIIFSRFAVLSKHA